MREPREPSTSCRTRRPAALASSTTSRAASSTSGETGRTQSCTGASQSGRRPAYLSSSAAVDHHHALAPAVCVVVGEVEALRLVEVDLHGRDGLLVTSGVDDLDVELGTVERRLPRSVDQL